MILVYILMLLVTDSVTSYPQRRPSITRKLKSNNEVRVKPSPFPNQPMEDETQRSLKQYIPIRRTPNIKEDNVNSRLDYYGSSEVDEFGQNRRSSRSNNNFMKRYITSDQIRPGKSQQKTSRDNQQKQNLFVTKKSDHDELKYSQVNTQQPLETRKTNNEYTDFQYKNAINFDTSRVTFTTNEPEVQDEYGDKHYFENPFLSTLFRKKPDFIPPIVENTPSDVRYLPPIQPNDVFSPSSEIISPNNQGVLVPLEDQIVINKNPFLERYFASNKSYINSNEQPEILKFDLGDLAPLELTKISITSPKPHINDQFSETNISPAVKYLPHIDVQQVSSNNHDFIKFSNYPFESNEKFENPHIAPNYTQKQSNIDSSEILKADNAMTFNNDEEIKVQHLPLTANNPEIIMHLPINAEIPQNNLFLPPQYSFDYNTDEFSKDVDINDTDDTHDVIPQDAIKEMSFESTKLRNPSHGSKKANEIKKVSLSLQRSTTTSALPLTTNEPSTTTILERQMMQIEDSVPQSDKKYETLRRNDVSPFLEDHFYTNIPLNNYNSEGQYLTPQAENYYTNYNERSNENWISFDTIDPNPSTTHNQQGDAQTINKEDTIFQEQSPYGSKIIQQQYVFPIERSNNQQAVIYEDRVSPSSKPVQSTTSTYESLSNNKKQPREFVSPTSMVTHFQEFNNHNVIQDNTGAAKSITDNKKEEPLSVNNRKSFPMAYVNVRNKPDEFISSTTAAYPKEFAKALKDYVERQNSKNKEETSTDKKIRQPKEFPKEFQHRSDVILSNPNDSFYLNSNQIDLHDNTKYQTNYNNYTYNRGPTTESIPVLKETKEMTVDGSFHYETLIGDQTHVVQEGYIENPGTDDEEQVIHGSYSFLGDDGKTYTVNYVADSNGFRASGDHLPTPPPIPDIIQRSIEKNLAEAEKNHELVSDTESKITSTFKDHNGIIERRSNPKTGPDSYEKKQENKAQQLNIEHPVLQPRKDREEIYYKPNYPYNTHLMYQRGEMINNRPIVQRRSDDIAIESIDKDIPNEAEKQRIINQLDNLSRNFMKNITRFNNSEHTINLDSNKSYQNSLRELHENREIKSIDGFVQDSSRQIVDEATIVNHQFAYDPVSSNIDNHPFYSNQYSRVQSYEINPPKHQNDEQIAMRKT